MAKNTDIRVQLDRILSEFSEEENDFIFECMKKAGKFAKNEVKANSPKNYGEYAAGWSIRTSRTKHLIKTVIYNKDFPGLTHLLEESHVIRNQYGTYGRTNPEAGKGGKVHIAPAQEKAEEYLLELLVQGH